jgi:hypothetical protein
LGNSLISTHTYGQNLTIDGNNTTYALTFSGDNTKFDASGKIVTIQNFGSSGGCTFSAATAFFPNAEIKISNKGRATITPALTRTKPITIIGASGSVATATFTGAVTPSAAITIGAYSTVAFDGGVALSSTSGKITINGASSTNVTFGTTTFSASETGMIAITGAGSTATFNSVTFNTTGNLITISGGGKAIFNAAITIPANVTISVAS